jgi:hypothetical protein
MPPQPFNIFDTVDEINLAEIQVFISVFFEDEILVYGKWPYKRMV